MRLSNLGNRSAPTCNPCNSTWYWGGIVPPCLPLHWWPSCVQIPCCPFLWAVDIVHTWEWAGNGTLPASCVGHQTLYISGQNSTLHQGKALLGQLGLILVYWNLIILWPEGPITVTACLTCGLPTLCLPTTTSLRVFHTSNSWSLLLVRSPSGLLSIPSP